MREPSPDIALLFLCLIALGAILLWILRLLYSSHRGPSDDAVRLIISIAGWLLMFSGLAVFAVLSLHIFSILALTAFVVVILMAGSRYRLQERRALLWTMAVAAERGVPLAHAAAAFADERPHEMGLRAFQLSDQISAGLPLPEAFVRSGTWLPADAELAVRVGTEIGGLGPLLRHLLLRDQQLDEALRSVLERLIYLTWIVFTLLFAMSFILLKIMPVYAKMFEEFELRLPAATEFLISAAEWMAIPLYGLVVLLLPVLGGATLYYTGLLPREMMGAAWLTRAVDVAHVLRCLAATQRLGIPVPRAVQVLARNYPSRSIRLRLQVAGRQVEEGQETFAALESIRLLTSAEAAVLRAAERAGNLPWACEELARSGQRRLIYRLRWKIQLVFPILVLTLGAIVLVIAVGCFLPLAALIQGLA